MAKEQNCHCSKILELLELVSGTSDSITLQGHINGYLRRTLDVSHVFMVPLLAERSEGLIQVINDQVLEKEIRFSVNLHNVLQTTFLAQ